MTITRRTATTTVLAGALVSLAAAAPFALADQPEGKPNGPKTTTTATTTTAPSTTTAPTTPTTPATPTPAEKKRGYGVLCKDLSKRHVKGEKGTPFSRCVVALAKIDDGTTTSPKKACKALSRKRVAGQDRSPFNLCVTAAAKQRAQTAQAD